VSIIVNIYIYIYIEIYVCPASCCGVTLQERTKHALVRHGSDYPLRDAASHAITNARHILRHRASSKLYNGMSLESCAHVVSMSVRQTPNATPSKTSLNTMIVLSQFPEQSQGHLKLLNLSPRPTFGASRQSIDWVRSAANPLKPCSYIQA